ncbi:hypothetical protein [Sulfurifustis variabilis]|uniref:hypothetical protein n=1 Tax=Sulfurifustis variabilis TaxID=1675686 RepID=UPI0011E4CF06|nr:hypothetical protein [Sulfurifustis variabilis]
MDRLDIAAKADTGRVTAEPCLAFEPDTTLEDDLDVGQGPEHVENFSLLARCDGRSRHHTAKTDPALGYSSCGIQHVRFWAPRLFDCAPDVLKAFLGAKNDVLFSEDQPRRADKTIEVAMPAEHE